MRDGVAAARQLVNDGFSCALSKALASFSDSHEERSFQKKVQCLTLGAVRIQGGAVTIARSSLIGCNYTTG